MSDVHITSPVVHIHMGGDRYDPQAMLRQVERSLATRRRRVTPDDQPGATETDDGGGA